MYMHKYLYVLTYAYIHVHHIVGSEIHIYIQTALIKLYIKESIHTNTKNN